ncbi:hypothetical protein HII36_21985 [Nonomuraea sp. NN258]|uniref:hypothetical protein n=1 Tax=Nonomuraea antri TaxID=2730852 RepID=UPI001567DFAB|nr:hypothetical protein [Nonomuraea antri]NRQ34498.1 hypothetical protein [Nonomuraea antri]
MSEAVIGLAGALIGASVALLSQLIAARMLSRAEWRRTLHTQCALIWALERDAALAAFDVYRGRDRGRWEQWDFKAKREAEAQILFVTHDKKLIAALRELAESGARMAAEIHRFRENPAFGPSRLGSAIKAHSDVSVAFAEVTRTVLGLRGGPADGGGAVSDLDWALLPGLSLKQREDPADGITGDGT